MHKKTYDDNEDIYYTPRSEFDNKDDKYKKNQQNNNIDTKPPNVFNYSKSLSQNAKDLMDEIEDADDDIDDGKLPFIGSNKEKFIFNTSNKPINFILAIYNGEISLQEAEFSQKELAKKNRGAKKIAYNYTLKSVKDFTQEIKSMSEKINLSLFEDFFESSSPADYAKMLINTSADEI